jgi:3-hydroxybutyryl-CoA dehydrogenase
VIGAGTMGHGIAQVAAMAGYRVALTDASPEAVERGIERIRANLEGGVERGKLSLEDAEAARTRITAAPDAETAADGVGLAVEAAFEDLDVKRTVFSDLERGAPPDAVLATNTSSISVGRIAEGVADPGRVVGMHFFNPVHVMKLLEVVVHPGTSDRARETALAAGRRMGKTPITVQDSPGFASSRLGVVLGLEAMRMLEQGVASAEDIDTAMELGYKHPMGPLKLTDLVGLDVRLAIAETLHAELGDERYRPPDVLRRKVEAGDLGKKSGRGFYRWDD